MTTPKRHSNSRTNMKRKSKKLHLISLSRCSNCGETKLPHRICPKCGYYDGKLIIPPKVKKEKTQA
ncbi:MAG: 50S ribosomal protein L32 [Candidatus Omnitrophica bacterium]|nr:50S ribosomal protein L32 [Candidatus Omnitrophota bacterium]